MASRADILAASTPILPGRNKWVNGACIWSQELGTASTTITAAAAIKWVLDQHYAKCTGANVTGIQQTSTIAGFDKSYKYTGAASVTGIVHGTYMEASTCAKFVNNDVCISINTKNSLLTTLTWTAYYPTVRDTFTSKTQIATGTVAINSSDGLYQATFNGGANIGNGLCVEWSVGAQTSGTWELTGLQVEAGKVATPFDELDPAIDLVRCQRFLTRIVGGGVSSFFVPALAYNTTDVLGTIVLPVSMRIAPAVTISAIGDFKGGTIGGGFGSAFSSLINVLGQSPSLIYFQFGSSSSLTAGSLSFVGMVTAGGWIQANARLS